MQPVLNRLTLTCSMRVWMYVHQQPWILNCCHRTLSSWSRRRAKGLLEGPMPGSHRLASRNLMKQTSSRCLFFAFFGCHPLFCCLGSTKQSRLLPFSCSSFACIGPLHPLKLLSCKNEIMSQNCRMSVSWAWSQSLLLVCLCNPSSSSSM